MLNSNTQAIWQLYEQMYVAMVAKRWGRVAREVHADDFVLVHMTEMQQTKAQYIRAFMDNTLNYFSAETENL